MAHAAANPFAAASCCRIADQSREINADASTS
jgi:hypothetical protein